MIQKQFFTVMAPALAALIVAGACKSEEGDDNAAEMVTASTTTPTTTVPPMPTGSATGTGTGVVGTANPLPTPTGTATTPPTGTATTAPTDMAPMCTNVEEGQGVNPMGPFGATWLFGYSDSTTAACLVKTTHCLDTATPGKFCFNGTAADAMPKYECWGAGIGLQMALADATSVKMPWDAAALGIAGVKFTIAGVAGGPKVRAQLSIAGLPDDATYVHGGGTKDIGADGVLTLNFADFKFPSWVIEAHATDLPDLATLALDATKIKALQLQVTTAPGAAKPYNFCVTEFSWVDAAGAPIAVTPLMDTATGGAGNVGGAGNAGGAGGVVNAGGAGGAGGAGPIASGGAGTIPDGGLPVSTAADGGTDVEPVPSGEGGTQGVGGAGGAGGMN